MAACKNHPDRKLDPRNKRGYCQECANVNLSVERKKKRTCKECGTSISRAAKTGVCVHCSIDSKRVDKNPDGIAVNGDNAVLTQKVHERILSLEDLVRVCQVDTNVWTVERYVVNKWEMGSAHKGLVKTTELFQVKAWLKRNTPVIFAKAQIEALVVDAQERVPRFVPACHPTPPEQLTSPYVLELQVPDLHLGKMAWGRETGYENYDTKIAVALYHQAIDTLVTRTRGFWFREIVLVVGNDLLHSDTKQHTTTKGTPLDVDSRYHKNYLAARRLLCEVVEKLANVAPVRVVVCPGNHDTLASFHLGDAVEMYFRDAANVKVDNEPRMRKYYAHGKVLLMWTHGNTGKLPDYPLLMAREVPNEWGKARFIEAHTGDKHQTKVQEFHGVRVRISPALCAPDAWHSEHHFVGTQRAAEAYVWHADEGLISVVLFTVPPEERQLCQ